LSKIIKRAKLARSIIFAFVSFSC